MGFDLVRFAEALSRARSDRRSAAGTSMRIHGAADIEAACGSSSVVVPGDSFLRSSLDLASTVVLFDRVTSTQDEARRLLTRGAPHGTLVLADEQTGGRGRRGRAWASPRGGGVWATIVLRPSFPATEAPWLTLAGALAICETARAVGIVRAAIKWPNDVIVEERKVGGILGELIADGTRGQAALLGLGLNVDLDPAEIADRVDGAATSLRAEGLSDAVGREEALARALSNIEIYIDMMSAGALEPLLDRWRTLSPSSRGRRVIVEDASGTVVGGITNGIDRDGSLRLRTENGGDHVVRFGGTLRFESGLREGVDAPRH